MAKFKPFPVDNVSFTPKKESPTDEMHIPKTPKCLFSHFQNCNLASAIVWIGSGEILENPILNLRIVIDRGGSFPLCTEHRKQLESSFPISGNEN